MYKILILLAFNKKKQEDIYFLNCAMQIIIWNNCKIIKQKYSQNLSQSINVYTICFPFVYSMNVFDMGKIICESDRECVKSNPCTMKYVES